jgi:hypothetical protein
LVGIGRIELADERLLVDGVSLRIRTCCVPFFIFLFSPPSSGAFIAWVSNVEIRQNKSELLIVKSIHFSLGRSLSYAESGGITLLERLPVLSGSSAEALNATYQE